MGRARREGNVQTGIDLEVGGLLPTFRENRGIQSERRREKGRVSKSLETARQADMESARSVDAYQERERKLFKRVHQALNEEETEIKHILEKQVHLERREKVYIISSKLPLLS